MTEKGKKTVGVVRNYSAGLSSFRMEGERCPRGICLRFAGIIGINEFSDNLIEINNHSGRVLISGKRLRVVVFENKQVEINGRVETVEFSYGKN